MVFHNDEKPIFEVPLSDVSTATVNKNEVEDTRKLIISMIFLVHNILYIIYNKPSIYRASIYRVFDLPCPMLVLPYCKHYV